MLTKEFFRGKRVTVFGLGLNSGGVGTVDFLVKNGAREVIVTDIKTREELAPSLERLEFHKNITLILGQHRSEDFSHVDLVIKNPIIPWTNEYIQIALRAKVPVEMDASIFMQLISPQITVIGVTGSKGKTTTATLLAHILEQAGKKVVRVGIGQETVLGKPDLITKESLVIFELSSWRLSSLHRIKKSPTISIITNIYPDHLNYYKTMEAYATDKEAIFAYQQPNNRAIFNQDNEWTKAMSERAPGKTYCFSLLHQEAQAFASERTIKLQLPELPLESIDFRGVNIFGKHNEENILAASLAARVVGLSPDVIEKGIKNFSGVPHRMELVADVKGVRYINDTAATIPDAAIASLSAVDTPIILIAGGSDKKLPLGSFVDAILSKARGIILLQGDATIKMETLLREKDPERDIIVVDSMERAVLAASRLAQSGDTVLLSPGCASFGLFQNEFDRGNQFKQSVQVLLRG